VKEAERGKALRERAHDGTTGTKLYGSQL